MLPFHSLRLHQDDDDLDEELFLFFNLAIDFIQSGDYRSIKEQTVLYRHLAPGYYTLSTGGHTTLFMFIITKQRQLNKYL